MRYTKGLVEQEKLNRYPGGVCEVTDKRKVKGRWLVLVLTVALFSLTYYQLANGRYAEVKKIVIIEKGY